MGEGALGIAREANQTLHLLAAGLWLGGAIFCGWADRRRMRAGMCLIRDAIRRFSQMGYLAVALIAVTGAGNTLLLVGSAEAMLSTAYRRPPRGQNSPVPRNGGHRGHQSLLL
jgi:putative copper resistance protein D